MTHLQIKAHVLKTSLPIDKHFLFFFVLNDAIILYASTYIYADLKQTKLFVCFFF